jgi:hypothetical protein
MIKQSAELIPEDLLLHAISDKKAMEFLHQYALKKIRSNEILYNDWVERILKPPFTIASGVKNYLSGVYHLQDFDIWEKSVNYLMANGHSKKLAKAVPSLRQSWAEKWFGSIRYFNAKSTDAIEKAADQLDRLSKIDRQYLIDSTVSAWSKIRTIELLGYTLESGIFYRANVSNNRLVQMMWKNNWDTWIEPSILEISKIINKSNDQKAKDEYKKMLLTQAKKSFWWDTNERLSAIISWVKKESLFIEAIKSGPMVPVELIADIRNQTSFEGIEKHWECIIDLSNIRGEKAEKEFEFLESLIGIDSYENNTFKSWFENKKLIRSMMAEGAQKTAKRSI